MIDGNRDPFDDIRRRVLERALSTAPFEGFTPLMMSEAAAACGVNPSQLAAAFPNGVGDLLAFWSARADQAVLDYLGDPAVTGSLRIREKVAGAIEARLAFLRPHKEAARRAAATLALPMFAKLGTELVWATADSVWRGLGDRSTDFNFYSKRAILSAVISSTMVRWFSDDSETSAITRQFLLDRIGNVMEFEKTKAELRRVAIDPEGLLGWLARLRFPASGRRPRGPHYAD